MGIPSYFSYIVKNHKYIIKKIIQLNRKINNLYLDSNSIIYDTLRKSSDKSALFLNICLKIDEYINKIQPNDTIIIAFDGVAPVAKLEQQRTRRYKSCLEKAIKRKINPNYEEEWDTTAITPGTTFMKDLGLFVKKYYKDKEDFFQVKKIIISDSNEIGEGEHKIFQYIRDVPHKEQNTVIYGLDADLIMLSLNHLNFTKNIYLYRETPEFIKSIHADLEPNETYILDIPKLAEMIIYELNFNRKPNTKQQKNRLYDYIFLCFFLGNDFMPHFPSINIRTNGIQIMLSAYQNTIGKTDQNLTDGKKIYWKSVRKLIQYLSENEWRNLTNEYKIRDKWEKRVFPTDTYEKMMMRYLHIPIKNRKIEKKIDPFNQYWEKRYYKELFKIDITEKYKRDICVNYIEGLEWTFKYYIEKCIDWRWCYKYPYPPLLKDLIKYIPYNDTLIIEENDHKAVSPYVQLAYVLPRESLYLLPKKIYDKLILEKYDYYEKDCEIIWAFCKYFWEAHVHFPIIDISELSYMIHN